MQSPLLNYKHSHSQQTHLHSWTNLPFLEFSLFEVMRLDCEDPLCELLSSWDVFTPHRLLRYTLGELVPGANVGENPVNRIAPNCAALGVERSRHRRRKNLHTYTRYVLTSVSWLFTGRRQGHYKLLISCVQGYIPQMTVGNRILTIVRIIMIFILLYQSDIIIL